MKLFTNLISLIVLCSQCVSASEMSTQDRLYERLKQGFEENEKANISIQNDQLKRSVRYEQYLNGLQDVRLSIRAVKCLEQKLLVDLMYTKIPNESERTAEDLRRLKVKADALNCTEVANNNMEEE